MRLRCDLPPTKVIRSSSLPTVISAPVSLRRREIVAPLHGVSEGLLSRHENLLGADDSGECGTGDADEDTDYLVQELWSETFASKTLGTYPGWPTWPFQWLPG